MVEVAKGGRPRGLESLVSLSSGVSSWVFTTSILGIQDSEEATLSGLKTKSRVECAAFPVTFHRSSPTAEVAAE